MEISKSKDTAMASPGSVSDKDKDSTSTRAGSIGSTALEGCRPLNKSHLEVRRAV